MAAQQINADYRQTMVFHTVFRGKKMELRADMASQRFYCRYVL